MYKRPFKKIPADVLENVQVKLDEVTTLLIPYAVILEPDERRFFPKMKDRIFEFVELSHGYACETPELVPFFMSVPLFSEEFFLVRKLRHLIGTIEKLKEIAGGIDTLAGTHALLTAMTFYDTVKIAARHDIPGSRVVYEELKPQFPLKKTKAAKGKRKEK